MSCEAGSFAEKLIKKKPKSREKPEGDGERSSERGTYPRDVPPPSLELSCLWALSSLNRKKEMETQNSITFSSLRVYCAKPFLGVAPKGSGAASATRELTVADRAALALWLDGARAGQGGTDDRVADHSPFLRDEGMEDAT